MGFQTRHLRLKGEIAQVRTACDFIIDAAADIGASETTLFQCELSIEEIFTNIVEHGYQHAGADKVIDLYVDQLDVDRMRIIVVDDAPPFNPLQVESPDASQLLDDRKGGGWGISFVKKYMDSVRYLYQDQRNHLVMEKVIR